MRPSTVISAAYYKTSSQLFFMPLKITTTTTTDFDFPDLTMRLFDINANTFLSVASNLVSPSMLLSRLQMTNQLYVKRFIIC